LRLLASTFADGDDEKVLLAMRLLPYDRLLLIGEDGFVGSASFARLRQIEEAAGNEVLAEAVSGHGFIDLVDGVSEVLSRHSRGNVLVLNISGGSKLLGDAALFAAFRHGVETYHCDSRLVRLPVMRGVSIRDMFTHSQKTFLLKLGQGVGALDDLVPELGKGSRQAVERTFRELRGAGLLTAKVADGKIRVALTDRGEEVLKALRAVAESG